MILLMKPISEINIIVNLNDKYGVETIDPIVLFTNIPSFPYK